jgi:hypothetical protein
MERIEVQGQTEQKVSETPISTNKPGMVVHSCNPSYPGGISRRLKVQGCARQKAQDFLKYD